MRPIPTRGLLHARPAKPAVSAQHALEAGAYARSTQVEHVPFAFWLVDELRPRVIIELATYAEVSYSAMG